MRILFDGRVLEGGSSGVRDIAEGLVRGLRSLETQGRISLLIASDAPGSRIADVVISKSSYLHFGLPRTAIRIKADRIMVPRQTVPLISPVPVVPFFHDIGFIRVPDLYPSSGRITLTTRIAATARYKLAVSEYTADELRAARLGARVCPMPISAVHDLTWRPDENNRYILCVAAQEPHKNLAALVKAWGLLDPGDYRLVLCGRRGSDTKRIEANIVASKNSDSISWFSGLDDGAYRNLLERCSGYVQPSLYEGLCIPALDLAAAGVPLVVGDASNLGRVFDGAPNCQLVNPSSEEDLARGLTALMSDSSFRAASSIFNSARVNLTDWEAVARAALGCMA